MAAAVPHEPRRQGLRPRSSPRAPRSALREPRAYRQFCGLARALDVVGERWTLLLVRNLLLGPRRYGDLLATLPGITTNLLAKRLAELVGRGLVQRTALPPPAGGAAYELTPEGRALEPVVMELARWGARYMDRPREGDTVDVGWALLSMKPRYRGGLSCTVDVVVGERGFSLRFEEAYLDVRERRADHPDVVVRAGLPALGRLWFLRERASARALEEAGELVVEGRRRVWQDVLRAFREA